MEPAAIELEYQALREEIVSRIETRSQTIFGVVTLAGVLYSFGLKSPAIAFMYPIVSVFLAASWAHNDISIKVLGKYIRDEIEPNMPGLRWQTLRVNYVGESMSVLGFRLTVLSAAGVFIVTQLVALIIGFSRFQSFTPFDWLVGALAFAFSLFTIALFRVYNKRIRT